MGDHYDQKPWLKFYDKHVPANLTYPEKPVWDVMSEAFIKFPDRKALYYMGTGFTYHDLDVMSNKFANYLMKNKVSKGDVVGVNLPNLPAYYVAMLGTLKAGCVLSGVSPLLSAEELKNQLIDSGAKVLVTLDALFLPRIKPMVAQTQVKHVIATSIGDYLSPIMAFMGKRMKKFPTGKIEQLPGINVLSFKDLMGRMPADPVHVKVYMDDTCVMQYTGGTTGLPKGAELTQRNIMSQVTQINTWLDANMGQFVGLTAFPLFHIAGLIIGMASFAKAVTLIAVPNPRDQKFIIGCMKKYKPDIVGNVPTVFLELMKQPEFKSLDFKKIQYFASGAAPQRTLIWVISRAICLIPIR
jgi:long-chain acyl-CoA synthetase